MLREELRHQPRKRARVRRPFATARLVAVALPQQIAHRRIPEQLACPLQQSVYLRLQPDAPYRARHAGDRTAHPKRLQPALAQQRNLIDLGEVVVLTRQPEHRHMINTGRRTRLLRPAPQRLPPSTASATARRTARPAAPVTTARAPPRSRSTFASAGPSAPNPSACARNASANSPAWRTATSRPIHPRPTGSAPNHPRTGASAAASPIAR